MPDKSRQIHLEDQANQPNLELDAGKLGCLIKSDSGGRVRHIS